MKVHPGLIVCLFLTWLAMFGGGDFIMHALRGTPRTEYANSVTQTATPQQTKTVATSARQAKPKPWTWMASTKK